MATVPLPVASVYPLQLADCLAALEALRVQVAVAPHLNLKRGRQGVDDRSAHAVETAGDRVPLAAELAAGVEGGHHRLHGRLASSGMDVYGDAPAVVLNLHGAVRLDGYGNAVAVAGHGLVHCVVDYLVDQVVEAPVVRAPDVHPGAAAHGLHTLQDLYVLGCIILGKLSIDRINHLVALSIWGIAPGV